MFRGYIRKHDEEFVATIARENRVRREAARHDVGKPPERRIPDGMAVQIVHRLEVVHIEQGQCERHVR